MPAKRRTIWRAPAQRRRRHHSRSTTRAYPQQYPAPQRTPTARSLLRLREAHGLQQADKIRADEIVDAAVVPRFSHQVYAIAELQSVLPEPNRHPHADLSGAVGRRGVEVEESAVDPDRRIKASEDLGHVPIIVRAGAPLVQPRERRSEPETGV